jgi:hypothetical protein
VYFANGRPKPAATAFRFPFVTTREGGTARILAWGRAPVAGKLLIEARAGGRWTVVRRASVRRLQVFSLTIDSPGRATLRAKIGTRSSLTWDQS